MSTVATFAESTAGVADGAKTGGQLGTWSAPLVLRQTVGEKSGNPKMVSLVNGDMD